MNKKNHIPCLLMRGGTSKGVFFLENDLPADPVERDQTLMKVMGSPDVKQINGLGGATSPIIFPFIPPRSRSIWIC